jgi:pteridine reductase
METEGKRQTALVTGAGTRVGYRIALQLAESGMAIAAHYHSSGGGAGELVQRIRASGGAAEAYEVDLAAEDGAEKLAGAVLHDSGAVDLLVNSASVWEKTPVGEITGAQFDRIMGVNLRAPFLLSLIIGRSMKQRGSGLIVNLLDWSIDRPYPDYVVYGMSKAALAAATRGLARALAPEVRVNAVAPGAVLLPDGISQREADEIVRAIPMKRIGSPDDVAEAILYLLRAPYTTGTILTVDGGRSLR